MLDRDTRKLQNAKADLRSVFTSPPSPRDMSDGEERIVLMKNKPMRLYRKENGRLWYINFVDINTGFVYAEQLFIGAGPNNTTIDKLGNINQYGNATHGDVDSDGNVNSGGSFQIGGSDIIDSSGYQTTSMFTRSYIPFGYNATLNTPIATKTTVDSYTLDGSSNTLGYLLTRNGKITGVSAIYNVDTPGIGTAAFNVQKNGIDQSMSASGVVTVGTKKVYSTANAFAVSAGDAINVEIVLQETGAISALDISNISILVELET